jgi:hypothetical protein
MQFGRLTTRRLMVVVAVVALAMGGVRAWERSRHCRMMAETCGRWESIFGHGAWICARVPDAIKPDVGFEIKPDHERANYYASMRRRHERVARYPWLPVPPDPSLPKP